MKIQKRIIRTICVAFTALHMMVLPICAAEVTSTYAEPRWNNIAKATLSIGFDANNIGYFGISIVPYSNGTGFDGMMRLFDADGNQLDSWSIYDHESPYGIEKTYQCEEGKTYTVTFQGYAYGTNSMYDEINLSVTDTCE